ncbi:AMP-binding protein [Paenibacillus sp. LHD-117]|uniref:AMP-binding protein n=1 Tax=Paenibacillus sp. LHD-117 TaxID=3071412 RepID=UPI0027DFCD53|nr:AMP-binding protein [Paenibacillus sp. LHD-117]MDQ6420596.1 AMP-binding protein [Paenibacillus sp. LHD-117]
MPFVFLLHVMYRMHLLSPAGIGRLLAAIRHCGVNVMALLHIAVRTYGDSAVVTDDRETASYKQLLNQSERFSGMLRHRYRLAGGKKVGLMGRNRLTLVRSVFAVSSTGADLYLLNAEMSASQLRALSEEYGFDLIIHDEELTHLVDSLHCPKLKLTPSNERDEFGDGEHAEQPARKPRSSSSGRIMLLTGGTTGKSKGVAHKPSLFHYLPPFSSLLARLPLNDCRTVYIATPIYHGYGIANLLLYIALGKKIVLSARFEAAEACRLIRKHQVDAVTVVPLMIHKMLRHNAEDLKSLVCIASGGSELNPKLAAETMSRLGDVLYNLYGTSEGGLATIATPRDLRASAGTIGRRIKGVPLHVRNASGSRAEIGEVGRLCIRGKRNFAKKKAVWIETGDLGYRDPDDLYRLCGRVDDMIVSAGENVYPIEVEQAIILHPSVDVVAVIGIPDELFGQRLIAYVQQAPQAGMTEAALKDWLRERLARYQLPKAVIFLDELPYTPLGKLDKKQLRARSLHMK